MREKATHCYRGHAFEEHGRTYGAKQVCMKCREEDRAVLAMIRKEANDGTTALAQLANKWDTEIREFALSRSVEEAVTEFQVEQSTVRRLLVGYHVNQQFRKRSV